MSSSFWNIIITIEIVLYLTLAYYICQTKYAIDRVDAVGIQTNFSYVEGIVYTLLILTYFMFVLKFFTHTKNIHSGESKHFCGLKYVNMALVTMLILFVRKFKDIMNMASNRPIGIGYIDENFKMVEGLSYALVAFNVLSVGLSIVGRRMIE